MKTTASEHIDSMPQLPQAQYALDEQLAEAARAASKLGLYDAEDILVSAIRVRRYQKLGLA